jgi:hypothetical protein
MGKNSEGLYEKQVGHYTFVKPLALLGALLIHVA